MSARHRKCMLTAAPRKGSLADRIAAFFAANPDEELTHDDLAIKFEACKDTVDYALAKLRATRLVEVVHVVRLRSKGGAK